MVLSPQRPTRRPQPLRPLPFAALALLLAALGAAASSIAPAAAAAAATPADVPRPGEVTLPLKDYLALVDSAERADAQRQAAARQEPVVAAVVSQHTAVQIGRVAAGPAVPLAAATAPATVPATTPATAATAAPAAAPQTALAAHFASQLEVLVQGHPKEPLALPYAGLASSIEVLPAGGHAAATGAGPNGPGLYLVTPEPGRFNVRAASEERLEGDFGVTRVTLPAIVAPVAAMDIDLPADLAWECAGAVVIDERVEGGRRRLRLSAQRGLQPTLVLRQAVAGDQASELLVQDVAATFFQLRPEGLRRHDVVLYEVRRGGLADFAVELPPGLEVERAATDEGLVTPVIEGARLVVHRRHRLQGSGYLVLTSRPEGSPGTLTLAAVVPQPAPRAWYLAATTNIPGSLAPRPAAAWTRVDLEDLPAPLAAALASLDTATAWRSVPGAGGLGLDWSTAPQAAMLETVVQRRVTTTLLTTDGTLLHRDSFELAQAGAVLSLQLPAGATLWSAAIDGTAVRPLERGERLDIPLGAGGARIVEVVAVQERAVPKGRSRLTFDLAQVAAPVIEHRWRLLLPESARYRFAAGSLLPVPAVLPGSAGLAAPPRRADIRWLERGGPRDPWAILDSTAGNLTDRINVGGNESGQGSLYVRPGEPAPARLAGRIVDRNGAALPGVTVNLVQASGNPLAQVTDARGLFGFRGVPPGTYTLRAELPGFATVEQSELRLEAGAQLRAELSLDEATEDTIVVTTESPMLDERHISVGAAVSTAELGRVPTSVAPVDAPVAKAATAPAAPPPPPRPKPTPLKDELRDLHDLRNGLVGGVRPLPITVPETGKALLLAGVLPPAHVTLELEVKAPRN